MQIPKPSDEDKERFRSLVRDRPEVVVKPMFGNLGSFVNGNMFAGLFGPTVGVRLAEADLGCTGAAVACTHGLFVGKAVDRLRHHPMITEVVTTDTVPAPADWPELKVRSVAGLFAEAIARVHAGESVSSLFDGVDPQFGPPQAQLFE